jgi:hypothetical protein
MMLVCDGNKTKENTKTAAGSARSYLEPGPQPLADSIKRDHQE